MTTEKSRTHIKLSGYHFVILRRGSREFRRLAKIILVKNQRKTVTTAQAIVSNALIPVTRIYGHIWFATVATR